MTTTTELRDAFRWHHANMLAAINGGRYTRHPTWVAIGAMKYARADVAAGKKRYPAPVKPYAAVSWKADNARGETIAYVQSVDGAGLRFVGRVVPDERRGAIWDKRGDTGWHTDPFGDVFKDGTGLCYGVVYQLPGKDGSARFVAGYEFGGTDGGPTLDMGTVYTGESYWDGSPPDCDAAIDAARAADSMAKAAAEHEREYQTAWQAGSAWAQEKDELANSRATVRRLLAERRQAKAIGGTQFPTICETIERAIRNAIADWQASRETMEALANGDSGSGHASLYFYTGDATLRAAFNDGAGETVLS